MELVLHLMDHDLSGVIPEEIIHTFGSKMVDTKQFMIQVNPQNKYGLEAMRGSHWTETHEYDDLLMEESSEYYILFKINNPYYQGLSLKRGSYEK